MQASAEWASQAVGQASVKSGGWPWVQNQQECWCALDKSQRGVTVQNTVCLGEYCKSVNFVIKTIGSQGRVWSKQETQSNLSLTKITLSAVRRLDYRGAILEAEGPLGGHSNNQGKRWRCFQWRCRWWDIISCGMYCMGRANKIFWCIEYWNDKKISN